MKHIHRFFTSTTLTAGEPVALEEGDSFHAARVLRLKPGDRLELADPEGRVFSACVTGVGGEVEAIPDEQIEIPAAAPALSVVQALPSGRKMDLVVEKLSELGVERLVPVYSRNSVVRPGAGRQFERWQRLARSSASQSRRARPLVIEEPRPLDEWLSRAGGSIVALVTEVEAVPLGECLPAEGPVTIVAGPEAGFAAEELDALRAAGVRLASLGPLLLRTETAALVAAAIALHRQGALG